MEPRTSTPQARLRTVKQLIASQVPTRVMVAPLIPMINDMELEKILQAASEAGARFANYVLLRLPYEVKTIFKDWLREHFPDRAEHIMSLVRQMRGGKEYDATFGKRMRGEGKFADLLALRFRMACKRFNLNAVSSPNLDRTAFIKEKSALHAKQLSLWED